MEGVADSRCRAMGCVLTTVFFACVWGMRPWREQRGAAWPVHWRNDGGCSRQIAEEGKGGGEVMLELEYGRGGELIGV